jgi:hypothetical protein
MRWIGSKVNVHPTYDGSLEVHNFLSCMEEEILTDQRISILDIALQDTPARWWATHKAFIYGVRGHKKIHYMLIPKSGSYERRDEYRFSRCTIVRWEV